MHNLIISGDEYTIDIVKSNELNILATNNVTKISYSVSLNEEKIYKITSNAGLIRDTNKFYEMMKMGLNNNNTGVILTGKTENEILILNLKINIIKELNDDINYKIILDKVYKSEIIRMEEIFSEIICAKKEISNAINNINQQINTIMKRIDNLEKNINICEQKKWNSISINDVNYYFGYKNGFYINSISDSGQTYIYEMGKKYESGIPPHDITEIIIPSEIVQNAKKIRILLTCNISSCRYDFKIWTQENDVRHFLQRAIGNEKCGVYFPGKYVTEMIFNITSTNNKIFVKGSFGFSLYLYLTGYKSK